MSTSKVARLWGGLWVWKGKQLNRSKEKTEVAGRRVLWEEPLWASTRRQRTTAGLLTRVARRSGVAGAVAGAAETVPGLPAPAAVLAVVGHTPAKGGGVNVWATLWGETHTYKVLKQVIANRSLSEILSRWYGGDYRRPASPMWESVKNWIDPPQDSNITVLYFFQNILTLNFNPDFVNTLQVEVAAGLLGFYLSQGHGTIIMSTATNTQADASSCVYALWLKYPRLPIWMNQNDAEREVS